MTKIHPIQILKNQKYERRILEISFLERGIQMEKILLS